MPPTLHSAPLAELPATLAHELFRLRADVFVVEQACAYPDLDGRDLEDGALQFWAEDGGEVVACLRRLVDPGGVTRIGRIATRADHRRRGLAAALVESALEAVDGPAVLDAQSQMVDWYGRFGFTPDGPEFVEDGIPHVPMRRP